MDLKFNTYAKAHKYIDSNYNNVGIELDISGQTGIDSARAIIYVSVIAYSKNTQISSGTYLSYSEDKQYAYALISYFPVDPKTNASSPYYSDVSGFVLPTITISSISSTRVQGTFSGALVYYFATIPAVSKDEIKQVTNGKFDVPIN